MCLSIWMYVIGLFSNRSSSYSFSLILTKHGTHDLHANTQETVEQNFKILIFRKCVASFFLNFKFLDFVEQQQSYLGQQSSSTEWSKKVSPY